MIKEYSSGKALTDDNKEFLSTNEYAAMFFYIDGKYLTETNKKNYVIKAFDEDSNETLLVMKVEPYPLLLFGSLKPVDELLSYMIENNYDFTNILAETELGKCVINRLSDYDYNYYESLSMDFLKANSWTEESSLNVEVPTLDDVDSIYKNKLNFVKDCGLVDPVNKDKIKEYINDYRVIKENDIVISMARLASSTENSRKIVEVYTLDSYRGNGYARCVVNSLKNEILDMGFDVCLNVDKNNPISNKLYYDLGFRKVFSQSEFRKI